MTIEPYDYVLATKYADGDPCDHFAVGFYARMYRDRYIVVDVHAKPFRANGFRRVEKITTQEGRQLLELFPEIGDKPGPSLWEHLERIRQANDCHSYQHTQHSVHLLRPR